MGSQVMEIVVWLLALGVVSILLGTMFQVLRGIFDGYMDRWEEKYLVNKKAEYLGDEEIDDEDDWVNDPDVQAFLEMQDEPGPWSEEDDKSYTVGGLTADKDRSFMKFQNKMDERDKQLGGNSDNNNDDEKEE